MTMTALTDPLASAVQRLKAKADRLEALAGAHRGAEAAERKQAAEDIRLVIAAASAAADLSGPELLEHIGDLIREGIADGKLHPETRIVGVLGSAHPPAIVPAPRGSSADHAE